MVLWLWACTGKAQIQRQETLKATLTACGAAQAQAQPPNSEKLPEPDPCDAWLVRRGWRRAHAGLNPDSGAACPGGNRITPTPLPAQPCPWQPEGWEGVNGQCPPAAGQKASHACRRPPSPAVWLPARCCSDRPQARAGRSSEASSPSAFCQHRSPSRGLSSLRRDCSTRGWAEESGCQRGSLEALRAAETQAGFLQQGIVPPGCSAVSPGAFSSLQPSASLAHSRQPEAFVGVFNLFFLGALRGDCSVSFLLTLRVSAARRRKVGESCSVPSRGFHSPQGSQPRFLAARNRLQALSQDMRRRLGTLVSGLGTLLFCTSPKGSAGAGGDQMSVSSARGSAAGLPHLREAQDLNKRRPRGQHKASRKYKNTFSSARRCF